MNHAYSQNYHNGQNGPTTASKSKRADGKDNGSSARNEANRSSVEFRSIGESGNE